MKVSTSKKGPFGLWMGMSEEEFPVPLEPAVQFKFFAPQVPKPHSAFDTYIVQIVPRLGLTWVKALGNRIDTSVFGAELKSAFNQMEVKLAATYGKSTVHDFLMPDSIWNEPKDWMQGIIQRERRLYAVWEGDSQALQESSLASIFLGVSIEDTSFGKIFIEYEFKNNAQAEKEIAALEDDAL